MVVYGGHRAMVGGTICLLLSTSLTDILQHGDGTVISEQFIVRLKWMRDMFCVVISGLVNHRLSWSVTSGSDPPQQLFISYSLTRHTDSVADYIQYSNFDISDKWWAKKKEDLSWAWPTWRCVKEFTEDFHLSFVRLLLPAYLCVHLVEAQSACQRLTNLRARLVHTKSITYMVNCRIRDTGDSVL